MGFWWGAGVRGCALPSPRRRQATRGRGVVARPAVDVVVLADDVPGVQAEVEGEAGVVASASAGEGGLDRLAGGGEDGEDPVAQQLALDRGASVVSYNGAHCAVAVARLPSKASV